MAMQQVITGKHGLLAHVTPTSITALCLCTFSGLAGLASGLGYQWGWWGLQTAFEVLRWAALGGLVSGVIALIVAIQTVGWRRHYDAALAGLGLTFSVIVVAVPFGHWWAAKHAPPIHDVTTDTANPPQFVAVLAARANSPDGSIYGGAQVAVMQHKAYPDIQPAVYRQIPSKVFRDALDVAQVLGWRIDAAVPSEGRIEATATTFWFGFKDDVVIRLTAVPQGTRVDVRSASRVGVSDLGANARRIREFLAMLGKRLQSRT